MTTFTNVTDRMQVQARLREANAALRRSQEEFRIVFENAATGMALVDRDGRLLRVNPKFSKILQYEAEELEGKTFAAITHPEDIDISVEPFRELVEGKRDGFRLKKRYIRKDGEICWTWISTSALRHRDGGFRYCVSMIEDITRQELAERSVHELLLKMLRVQEEEQRRIARELHDSTSQELAALTLNLASIARADQNLSKAAKGKIDNALNLAKNLANEIRTFSYLLYPPMLERFGIWEAIRAFVGEFERRSSITVRVEIADLATQIKTNRNCEMALFRFVQEALANVHRHSAAKFGHDFH